MVGSIPAATTRHFHYYFVGGIEMNIRERLRQRREVLAAARRLAEAGLVDSNASDEDLAKLVAAEVLTTSVMPQSTLDDLISFITALIPLIKLIVELFGGL